MTPVDGRFADIFREAMGASGLSLSQVTARMAQAGHVLTKATLSAWQTGSSEPRRASTLAALPDLEFVLGLPPGMLASALGRSDQDGPRWRHQSLYDTTGAVDEVRRRWGISWHESLARETVWARCHVQPDRRRRVVFRTTLRALDDGADRIVTIVHSLYGNDLPTYRPVAGCALGRQEHLAEGRGKTVEILLPAPLLRGQRMTIEYETHWPPVLRDRFELRTAQPVDMLLVQVVFPDELRPTEVRRIHGQIVPGSTLGLVTEDWEPLQGLSASTATDRRYGAITAVEWRGLGDG